MLILNGYLLGYNFFLLLLDLLHRVLLVNDHFELLKILLFLFIRFLIRIVFLIFLVFFKDLKLSWKFSYKTLNEEYVQLVYIGDNFSRSFKFLLIKKALQRTKHCWLNVLILEIVMMKTVKLILVGNLQCFLISLLIYGFAKLYNVVQFFWAVWIFFLNFEHIKILFKN